MDTAWEQRLHRLVKEAISGLNVKVHYATPVTAANDRPRAFITGTPDDVASAWVRIEQDPRLKGRIENLRPIVTP